MSRDLQGRSVDLRRPLRWLTIVLVAASCGSGPSESPAIPSRSATSASTVPTVGPATSAPAKPAAQSQAALGYEAVSCDPFTPPDARPAGYIRSCGSMQVPENRTDPNSRVIRLQVVIVASEDPNPAPDPVLIVAHGAGGETVGAYLDGPTLAALRQHRDVILVDGRGTGGSTPSLDCFESVPAALKSLTTDRATAAASQLSALTVCRDRLVASGVDLGGYNSIEIAADMADLRIALGYENWNLFGASYGTLEELEVMRSHPEGIRSVVLDSVKPPDVDSLSDWGPNGDAALETLFGGCAADPACARAHPGLGATFDRLVDDLDTAPMTLEFRDPWADTTRTGTANGDVLITGVYNALYDTAGIGALPGRIDAIAKGDTDLLESSLAVNANAFGAEAALYSVYCRDDFVWTDPDRIRAAARPIHRARLGELFTFWALWDLEPCRIFGAARGDPAAHGPVTSEIPTLILSGEYDPITPPAWGKRALATLDRGSMVVFPGVGHGVLGSNTCAEDIVNRFLNDPTVAVDESCAAALDLPRFP